MTTATPDIAAELKMASGKRRWKRMVGWLVVLLLLAGGAFFVNRRWTEAQKAPTIRYRTEDARIGDLTVTVTATGQLQPTRDVSVGSEVSGIIDAVEVNYNDHVKAGQVLARINTEKLDAQVAQDKAALDSARAKVDDAKVTVVETEAEYKRIQAARARSNNQLPSQHDLDAAKASYERAKVAVVSAQATVTQSEANLAIDQTNVAKAVIKSPVDGYVLARNVEPGQTLASSFSVTTMFDIAEDLRRMKLQVNIDEADVGEVKAGQPVKFTVDAYPGRPFPGQITQLRYQSTTTNNVVTYLAVISVENGQMLLRPGMTATATITVQAKKNALLVPNLALRFAPSTSVAAGPEEDGRGIVSKLMPGPPPMKKSGGQEAEPPIATGGRVFVLRNGKPAAVPVKTGLTNGKVTEILSGSIAAGVPVVVESVRVQK